MQPDYELAYRVTGHILAQSITALLKSFGIDAYLSQESAGIAYGLTIGSLGEARIYVRADQLEFLGLAPCPVGGSAGAEPSQIIPFLSAARGGTRMR